MCHYCRLKLAKSRNCMEQKVESSIKLNSGESVQSCEVCREKKDKESINWVKSSPNRAQSISPTTSLRSCSSSLSSCSDISVDTTSSRGYAEDSSAESSQEDPTSSLKGHLGDSNFPAQVNGFHRASNSMKEMRNASNTLNGGDAEAVSTSEGLGGDSSWKTVGSSIDDKTRTGTTNAELNAQFWFPPEPEDEEDDVVGSVANYYDDDDDECGDGVNWARSSSLGSFGEEGSGSYKFIEQKRKAMDDVMNGKFKSLVSQLLKSVGVASPGKNGEKWVDIVTSLSWEAAAFVKPDATEGKAMDPDGSVKIKCVATGSCNQSRVIKGLVFKKHAAHKHMPTKYKNPRLLLIQGSLDLSSSGLSSLEAMEQEKKDSLRSIIETIEMCHPNVILVAKTVSRDIQESILAKGMTLVFDMKLHRLERVARCIGSPILSSDIVSGQKLRQCDSFYIQKFVEEHAASVDGGKRQSKTLMFLEGSPTHLGCSILLMGASSDELKKIKSVVRCAVVMAYHLMLETSFLLDQRAMFSTMPLGEVVDLTLANEQSLSVGSGVGAVFSQNESIAEMVSSLNMDIPIFDGFPEASGRNLIPVPEGKLNPYNPSMSSGSLCSASLEKVMNDSFPHFTDSSQSQLELKGNNTDDQVESVVKVSSDLDIDDSRDDERKSNVEDENLLENGQPDSRKIVVEGKNLLENGQPHPSAGLYGESLDAFEHSKNCEDRTHSKDEISLVLDSESILVLLSTRNASRGTICEQSHFSHIKFYRNFDVPLGKFLRDNLLNQKPCKTCGEPPEAHFYYYAHHNKQLTVQVRRLPKDKTLPGESEGKLWMWSRCGECKFHNGSLKSTKRVLISTAARGLSFGKFLELGFSSHNSFSNSSSCGHSFHEDFLYFFGLGPMVAMFKYAPVATYSVSLPPKKLGLKSSIKEEYVKRDFKEVRMKGISMFSDIERSLKDMGARYVGATLNIQGSSRAFSDIQEMLKEERYRFEVDIDAVENGSGNEAVYKLLSLNRVRLELMLESYIWDRRLRSLLLSDLTVTVSESMGPTILGESHPEENGSCNQDATEVPLENCGIVVQDRCEYKIELVSSGGAIANNDPDKEIPFDHQVAGSGRRNESGSPVSDDVASQGTGEPSSNGSPLLDSLAKPVSGAHSDALDSSVQLQTDKVIPVTTDAGVVVGDLSHSQRGKPVSLVLSNLENNKGWIWTPFPEIWREYMEDLRRGYLPKLENISSHGVESMAYKLITDEGPRLHIPLGIDDYIVSDYEDEFSSIIACALALLKDRPISAEDLAEDAKKERGTDVKQNESLQSLTRMFSLSTHWSSFASSDLDGIHSSPLVSSGELHSSSFDGLDLLESLVSFGASHPEVSMGAVKSSGKCKYSVVCLYANQFCQLRERWCQSEVDYITSLSRCRHWDAKGGKSKSFFAKTLDDRFIIKEIKKTEFDSFMKFAPGYFEYMNQCYENQNPTCLAKILGIYQVTLRATKNGKETRHDLLVMENLSYVRSISRQYDLKGALHARFNSAGNGSGDVLLDQNFVNDMNISPLYISKQSKRYLQRAVWNDCHFLNSVNVMDYSLLVGVDAQRCELVCGIIDYLRQYTWDKQLESWVKASLVVPKNQKPTVISPVEYKKRFRKFIDTHFLCVPDHWCSQRSSNPCRLCGIVEETETLPPCTNSQNQVNHSDDSSHAKFEEQGNDEEDSS